MTPNQNFSNRIIAFAYLICLYCFSLGCANYESKHNDKAVDSTQKAVKVVDVVADKEAAIDPEIIIAPLKQMAVPKDIGVDKLRPIGNTSPDNNLCGNPVPRTLGELNQIDKSSSIISKTAGLDLSLWGVSGNLGRRDVLIISNFLSYKDFNCGGITKRVAVGIQVYIHAISKSYKIHSADIVKLAANVELGKASADYHIHIFGLSNAKDVYKNLPPATFDVDSYAKITSSFDGLISGLSDKARIDPIISDIK
jgi:hypothetical protein